MEVKNISKNTLFVEDVGLHLPYDQNKVFTFSPDLLKKSRSLRSLIFNDFLEIINHDPDEQIEKSIVYTKSQIKTGKKEEMEEEISSPNNDIEVKIHGIFYEAGGYGKVNRYLATNLSKKGIKVKVSPKRGQNHLNEDELKNVVKLEKTPLSRDHIVIDSIIPSFSEISAAKYKIIYTTIESYSIPQQFVDCCNQYNEIFVTSPFAFDVLKKYDIRPPVYIVPTGVDPDIYNEQVDRVVFNPSLKDFIFISVFGWSYRKGYDLLFKSYFEAFNGDDDVSLLVFSRYMQGTNPTYNKKIQSDIDQVIPQKSNPPHYKVVSKIVPESLMPQIYRACDAFVLPSRAEGSNLCVCEASLCGLPVIMTNCSGQRMYLRHNNSFLLEIDNLQKLEAGLCHVHFWDEQIFPALRSKKCVGDLAGLMRQVYENYDDAVQRNKKLQDLLLGRFTWQHAAETAYKRLVEINRKVKK